MSYAKRWQSIINEPGWLLWNGPKRLSVAQKMGSEADAKIAALRAELDNVREAFEIKDNAYRLLKEVTEQHRARVEALEAALREVCDDYEEVIDGEFGPNPMPIQPVVRARALLEKKP